VIKEISYRNALSSRNSGYLSSKGNRRNDLRRASAALCYHRKIAGPAFNLSGPAIFRVEPAGEVASPNRQTQCPNELGAYRGEDMP